MVSNKITKMCLLLLVPVCLALSLSVNAQTQSSKPAVIDATSQREALQDIKSLHVVVENVTPDLATFGVTDAVIKTDTELRLRKAGIHIDDSVPAYIDIILTVYKYNENVFVYSITVEFNTIVYRPVKDQTIRSFAALWNARAVGDVGTQKVREIRADIGDIVDKFINDYLAANPK